MSKQFVDRVTGDTPGLHVDVTGGLAIRRLKRPCQVSSDKASVALNCCQLTKVGLCWFML